MFVADAASNEQGAGRCSKQVFPNVVSVQRDRAHACQRILKRPWEAVAGMKQVLDDYIFGSGSIVQKIHHSKGLQDVFSGFAKQIDSQWQKKYVTSRQPSIDLLVAPSHSKGLSSTSML